MFKGGDLERLKKEFPPTDCPIGLSQAIIPAKDSAESEAYPQVLYRPRRLVVDRSYPMLRVVDLKIGATSQFMSAGSFPLDALLPLKPLELIYERLLRLGTGGEELAAVLACREELAKIHHNLGTVDTCHIGQVIRLRLANTSDVPVTFWGALMLGDSFAFDSDGKALHR